MNSCSSCELWLESEMLMKFYTRFRLLAVNMICNETLYVLKEILLEEVSIYFDSDPILWSLLFCCNCPLKYWDIFQSMLELSEWKGSYHNCTTCKKSHYNNPHFLHPIHAIIFWQYSHTSVPRPPYGPSIFCRCRQVVIV